MTTLSYIYVAESQFKSVRWSWAATTKGICLIWSRGRLLPPSLPCRGQGIGKQLGTTSSRHKRSTGRNLVVHRHGTALRQSVQEVPLSAGFLFSLSLFSSHFVLNMPCERHSDYILVTGDHKKSYYATKAIWARFDLQRTRWVRYFSSRSGWLDTYNKTTKLEWRDFHFAVVSKSPRMQLGRQRGNHRLSKVARMKWLMRDSLYACDAKLEINAQSWD